MRRIDKLRLMLAAIFISILVGCVTPQGVRTLSEEQVKVQESYLESQKVYFSVIENFVESQIKVTEALLAAATLEINAKYKKKALRAIDPTDDAKTRKALDELAENLLNEQKSDQEGLLRIKGYHTELKELHKRMLKALGTIVAAQKKLNDYIQLQKADEYAVNQLLTIVGLEGDKVDKAATAAANVYAEIEKYIKGGSAK